MTPGKAADPDSVTTIQLAQRLRSELVLFPDAGRFCAPVTINDTKKTLEIFIHRQMQSALLTVWDIYLHGQDYLPKKFRTEQPPPEKRAPDCMKELPSLARAVIILLKNTYNGLEPLVEWNVAENQREPGKDGVPDIQKDVPCGPKDIGVQTKNVYSFTNGIIFDMDRFRCLIGSIASTEIYNEYRSPKEKDIDVGTQTVMPTPCWNCKILQLPNVDSRSSHTYRRHCSTCHSVIREAGRTSNNTMKDVCMCLRCGQEIDMFEDHPCAMLYEDTYSVNAPTIIYTKTGDVLVDPHSSSYKTSTVVAPQTTPLQHKLGDIMSFIPKDLFHRDPTRNFIVYMFHLCKKNPIFVTIAALCFMITILVYFDDKFLSNLAYIINSHIRDYNHGGR